MDPNIREALADVKQTVRDGFITTNERFNELVTQGEFRATIQRVDAQHENLRRDFDIHVEGVPGRDQAAITRDEALRSEFRADLEGFRTTTRWAVGIAATVVGIGCTIVFSIINTVAP